MNELMLTSHAIKRMAQRGFKLKDAELIALIGTEVEGGYIARRKDCQEIENQMVRILEGVRRIRGMRLVVATGQVITAYRPNRSDSRRLLRSAYESDY